MTCRRRLTSVCRVHDSLLQPYLVLMKTHCHRHRHLNRHRHRHRRRHHRRYRHRQRHCHRYRRRHRYCHLQPLNNTTFCTKFSSVLINVV